jgi:haloalkane dehalogenase
VGAFVPTQCDGDPKGAELFRGLRTPGVGEKMVLETNQFLDRSLANGIKRPLSQEERAAYYAPYAEAASRRPIASSPSVPKLLLSFDPPEGLQPSPTGSPAMIEWARTHLASLDMTHVGTASHHAPEDLPQPIAAAIATWLDRHRL